MKKISGNVYQINLGIVNAFVVEDNGLTLIDTGVKNSMEKIFAAIRKGGKNPDHIRRIILTHAHSDHSGSAATLKKKLGIPILAHEADALLMSQGIAGRIRTGNAPVSLTPGAMNWLIYNLFIKKAPKTIEPLITDQLLSDNELLPIAGGIKVIHTPGHCAGHLALLILNEGLLIAGDICANAPGLALSTLYEDRVLGIKSILKAASNDFGIAVFGHGKPLMKNASQKMKQTFTKCAAKYNIN